MGDNNYIDASTIPFAQAVTPLWGDSHVLQMAVALIAAQAKLVHVLQF